MLLKKLTFVLLTVGLISLFPTITTLAQPVIEVEQEEIDFGEVEVDETGQEEISIANDGDEQLIITGFETDNDAFSAGYNNVDMIRHIPFFEYDENDNNHLILVIDATWDDEILMEGVEVGVFLADQNLCLCANTLEEANQMIGLSAWFADEQNNMRMSFRFWDPGTECEVAAEAEFTDGPDVLRPNGFSTVELTAEGGCHRIPDDQIIINAENSCDVPVRFEPDEVGDFEGVLTVISNDHGNEGVEVRLTGTGIDGENDPPVIIHPVNEDILNVFGQENLELEIIFFAEDPEDDNDLEWTIEDVDDLPGENGDGWEFSENDFLEAVFTWDVGIGYARAEQYSPVFRATDSGGQYDEITVNIFILDDENVIPEQELIEDCERTELYDLDDLFEEIPGEITFRGNPDDPLRLQIDENNMLSAQPIPDFCAPDPGVEVNAMLFTEHGFCAILNFTMIVHPLNDPPGEFDLISPDGGFNFDIWLMGMFEFNWETAEQNEYEIDTVRYSMVFKSVPETEDSLIIPDIFENQRELLVSDIADGLGWWYPYPMTVLHWYVIAVDDSAHVIASNAPFEIFATYSIDEDRFKGLIPQEFVIYPAYPNPFNSFVSVSFGIPSSGQVKFQLYDLNGKIISVYPDNSAYSAGYHTYELDLKGIPAGIYLLQANFNDVTHVQRVVLLK
ncbi:T9SS type A sorting domain-containing protein [bacterium]|nr:T9SS type A sorting domain-containing protein [bacterium]